MDAVRIWLVKQRSRAVKKGEIMLYKSATEFQSRYIVKMASECTDYFEIMSQSPYKGPQFQHKAVLRFIHLQMESYRSSGFKNRKK